jgi:hypothetical protein
MTMHWPEILVRSAPTWFQFMGSRYDTCVQIVNGTRVPGAAPIDNTALLVAVPAVSKALHLSVAGAYDLIMGACLILATLVGALAIRKWDIRIVLYFFTAVGLTALASDAYAFQAFPAIAGIPWLIRFSSDWKRFAITAILVAFTAGVCDLMRYRAAMPYMAMLVAMAFVYFAKLRAVMLTLVVLLFSYLPGAWFYRYYPLSHPMWHNIYIGLGWVHNSEVPEYLDAVGGNKVRSIDPSVVYCGPEYEAILRREIFRIAREKPWIIAVNVAGKLTAIALMLAIILFPVRKNCRLNPADTPMVVAMVLGMLPGVLVTPNFRYVLAGLCFSLLFGIRAAFHGPMQKSAAMAS